MSGIPKVEYVANLRADAKFLRRNAAALRAQADEDELTATELEHLAAKTAAMVLL